MGSSRRSTKSQTGPTTQGNLSMQTIVHLAQARGHVRCLACRQAVEERYQQTLARLREPFAVPSAPTAGREAERPESPPGRPRSAAGAVAGAVAAGMGAAVGVTLGMGEALGIRAPVAEVEAEEQPGGTRWGARLGGREEQSCMHQDRALGRRGPPSVHLLKKGGCKHWDAQPYRCCP